MASPNADGPDATPGASSSFSDFYARTWPHTVAAAWRATSGDIHVAHDATQDAYVVMFRLWPDRQCRSFEESGRYVTAIAVKKVADWYRKHAKVVGLDEDFDGIVEEPGFGAILEEMSILDAVRKVIREQPAQRRAVAVLCFLEDFTYAETAAALDISPSTVRTHVRRIRTRLRPLAEQDRYAEGGERR